MPCSRPLLAHWQQPTKCLFEVNKRTKLQIIAAALILNSDWNELTFPFDVVDAQLPGGGKPLLDDCELAGAANGQHQIRGYEV